MPAFSGLWDGVYGDGPYASDNVPQPPIAGGIGRVLMQKRGMYGMVRGFGRVSPTSVACVTTELPSITVRGGYDYANREDDAANEVEIVHAGGDLNTIESLDMPATATDEDMSPVADTTLNSEYAGDEADSGATGTAWPGALAT